MTDIAIPGDQNIIMKEPEKMEFANRIGKNMEIKG